MITEFINILNAMTLKKEGATVSFLIATPQTGVDSTLPTYGVLGLPFAIIRPIVVFIVGVVESTVFRNCFTYLHI